MANADASAVFDLEDDSLAAGLDNIAARFEQIAAQINSTFAGANAQLGRTAQTIQAVGASAPATVTLANGLALAANAGRHVAVTFSGIATTVTRLMPLARFLPDSLGAWVPKVKQAAKENAELAAKVGLVTSAAAALTGRLTVLQAGFSVLQMRELAVGRTAAVFGAAGALATSKIIAGARGASSAIGGLASRMGRAASGMGGALAGAMGGIGRSVSSATTIFAPVAGLALALGPVGAAAIGIAAGFSAVGKSISAAAKTQSLQTSFVTLLGSADAARKRMSELSKFAASTPFDIPGVTRASKVLETLTKGALSTGSGLRMVGDAAAVSGQPMQDLAVHIGRLYDGLMNGRPVGEALMRLQELGLISSETRGRIEALQKSGEKGGSVWAVAASDLMRFSGEMQRQSGTWNGLMSNLSDAVGNVFRAFGAPVITALTPFMQRLIAWLGTLTTWAEKAGSIFAGWSALIAQVFADGKMGEALSRVGKIAFMEWVNFVAKNWGGLFRVWSVMLEGVARGFMTLLAEATTADFWKGVGNALKSGGEMLLSLLLEGVAKILDSFRDVPGVGDKAGAKADQARELSAKLAEDSIKSGSAAGTNLGPVFDKVARDMGEVFKKVGDAFAKGRNETGDFFDTSAFRAELAKFIQPIAREAQKAVNGAAAAAEKGSLPAPIAGNATGAGGTGKNEVAGLQRIGGGGFSNSRADLLLAENRNQTNEIKGLRSEVKGLREALTQHRTTPTPVFS